MKLDLRKTRAATVVDDLGDDFLLYEDEKNSFLSNIEIDPKRIIGFVVRLALCALGVVVLRYIEKQNLDKLNGQKSIVQNELNQLAKKQKEKEKEVEGFAYMAKKSKEFYNKLDIMQELADSRLLALTGLDHIQSIIPEEVWLQRVNFDDKKFTITGTSTTNKQIQNFIEKLEDTQLFSNVNLEKAIEDKDKKNYIRRNFIIKSTLK